MPRYADRTSETVSGTPGYGPVTFGGASAKCQTFAVGLDGRLPCVIGYVIEDGTAWEVGKGTVNSTGTQMTRDVLRSSSTGSFLSLSSSAVVFCAPSAEQIDNANIGQINAQARGLAMP